MRHSPGGGKEDSEEPVESCPAVALRAPSIIGMTRTYILSGEPLRFNLESSSTSLGDPPEGLLAAQDALAERLYSVYSTLASVPVPQLLRPVCQWLGLRWLAKGDQHQAARYFGQATGITACGIFKSVLCSKSR